MTEALLGALLPGRAGRHQPRLHPYTTGGRQADVAHEAAGLRCGNAGWPPLSYWPGRLHGCTAWPSAWALTGC